MDTIKKNLNTIGLGLLVLAVVALLILGAVVMFLLILVGLNPLLVGLPAGLAATAARIGVMSHFDSIGRGNEACVDSP